MGSNETGGAHHRGIKTDVSLDVTRMVWKYGCQHFTHVFETSVAHAVTSQKNVMLTGFNTFHESISENNLSHSETMANRATVFSDTAMQD